MIRSVLSRLWLIALVGLLTACGNTSIPAAQTDPAGARPTSAPPPTDTPAARAAATLAPAPTAAAPPAATQAPAPTAAAAGIPEGRTPEGYHFLGRADAPVTLVMYSDFL